MDEGGGVMKMTVRWTRGQWQMLDENRKPSGWIRFAKGHGRQMEVCGPKHEPVCRVEKKGSDVFVYQDGEKVAVGTLVYETDPSGQVRQPCMVRPPMPVCLKLESSRGTCSIVQKPDRSLLVYQGRELVGGLEHMLSLTRQVVSCNLEIPPSFLAVLYVLGYYMVHDDDVDLV